MNGFYLRDGVSFQSDEEGNVYLCREEADESITEIQMTPHEWASVIAYVSGDPINNYQRALAFHKADQADQLREVVEERKLLHDAAADFLRCSEEIERSGTEATMEEYEQAWHDLLSLLDPVATQEAEEESRG